LNEHRGAVGAVERNRKPKKWHGYWRKPRHETQHWKDYCK